MIFCSLGLAIARPAIHRRHSAIPPSPTLFDVAIPEAKVRPSVYSGILKTVHSFWFRSHYTFRITDTKGKTIAYLDTSQLVTGAPLCNYQGKEVTVTGRTFPHRHRGVVVIKAQSLAPSTNSL